MAAAWNEQQFEAELAGEYLRDSYLGRMGHAIEPADRAARVGIGEWACRCWRRSRPGETIIATLGTIFNIGEGRGRGRRPAKNGDSGRARWEHSDRPLFTLPVALSIMVFFALCAQCASTLVIMGREMDSFVWPVISFVRDDDDRVRGPRGGTAVVARGRSGAGGEAERRRSLQRSRAAGCIRGRPARTCPEWCDAHSAYCG